LTLHVPLMQPLVSKVCMVVCILLGPLYAAIVKAQKIFVSRLSAELRGREESDVFGWSQMPKNITSRTPDVQRNYLLHRTPELGIQTRAC